jgi:DNA-binding NarL/FixJ family response regulator
MSNVSVRILVVEDFDPFRSFICSMLRKQPHFHIVCEVADGLQAVQKAKEVHPDLILLDIGLPTLNGVEAGRHIRLVAPESRIVFVSQESSTDVIREALTVGQAYVIKAHAASDLLPAVNGIMAGHQFASAWPASHNFIDATEGPKSAGIR